MRSKLLGARVALLLAAAAPRALSQSQELPQEQPGRADLQITCPTLDQETRALLEARARAELAVEPLPGGTLRIACEGTAGTVVWVPSGAGQPQQARQVDLSAGASVVDAILAALHDVFVASTAPPPAAPTTTPAPPSIPIPPATPAPAPPASPPPPPRAALIAGLTTELWSGAITAAPGAQAGAHVRLVGPWSAALLAGADWGLGTASGAHAWDIKATARIDYDLVRPLQFSLGLDGRLVTGTDGSQTQRATTAGLVAAARYRVPVGPLDVTLGPTLEILARPVAANVGATEMFRLPTAIAGLAVELTYPAR